MSRLTGFLVFAFVGLLATHLVRAQALQTGTLTGQALLADGSGLPGVTVTIASPSMQGTRTQGTGASGDYVFKFLPPGAYSVVFELAGMQTVERNATVELGGTARADATLEVTAATEAVTVSGDSLDVEKTAVNETVYDAEFIQSLPTGRRLDQIGALAPGVTTNTPNAQQLQISGGFAFDNLFLVDGVDVIDNQFGDVTVGIVIEEAIAETQILTSGISAEFGRFSGGVVNAITKSGGNEYHGSFRSDLTNADWRENTPFEDERDVQHTDQIIDIYSGSFGGRILRDRLWFFAAARYYDVTDQDILPVTGASFEGSDTEYRLEGKLTGQVAPGHSLQAAYTDSEREVFRTTFAQTADLNDPFNETDPSSLFVASYNGVFTDRLFGSLQYSQKHFGFRSDTGSTDFRDSSFITLTQSFAHYGGRYFDNGRDPEDRDNKQISGALNYYLSSQKGGTHDLKVGGEWFQSIAVGGNSQGPTEFNFRADYAINPNGSPILTPEGFLQPEFRAGRVLLLNWVPQLGAESQIDTTSVYVNDSWRINKHLSANIGLRYEMAKGEGPGGSTIADEDALMPRVGMSYDVKGDGRFVMSGTYGQYAGRYQDSQFNNTTNVGNPDLIYYVYVGPRGIGFDFDPGFDRDNYLLAGANFPALTNFQEDTLHSPVTEEFTLSVGGQLSSRLYGALTYVNRDTDDFIEDFILFENGQTVVEIDGIPVPNDNIVHRNTNLRDRKYQALLFQGGWNPSPRLRTQVNYTYNIKFEGNFEGEAASQPGLPSLFADFPEILNDPNRYEPYGRLAGYQKHKLRLLGAYALPTRFGNFDFGAIWRFDSGTPYSLAVANYTVTDTQLARDPGYALPPTTATLYFDERGSELFPDITRLDLSLQYELPVWKSLSPWLKVDVFNVLNEDELVTHNTSIIPDENGPLDANGQPTTFTRSVNFGRATGAASYQRAREFQISAGIRF